MVMERIASPLFKARISGLFYVLMFVTGLIGMFVAGGLVSHSSYNADAVAAATASNIQAHESSILVSVAGNVIVVAFYLAVTALWYGLFRPVNKSLALLAAFFSVVGCAVEAVTSVFLLAPAVLGGNAHYLGAFSSGQFQALAYMFIRLYFQGLDISLVFFGFYDLLIGYLTFRSTFLPRIVGVLMMIAGLSWLTFLWLPLGSSLLPYNLVPGASGEALMAVWLLVKGVNVQRWKEESIRTERAIEEKEYA
jgi:Domain of unknown function (DUF4386)